MGYSRTYLLSGNKKYNSWSDSNIKAISKQILDSYQINYRNNFEEREDYQRFPYYCQYNENDFEFLKRMFYECGEAFYHNGLKLIVGNPKNISEPILIDINREVDSFEEGIQALGDKSSTYSWNSLLNDTIVYQNQAEVSGLDSLGNKMVKVSKEIKESDSNTAITKHRLRKLVIDGEIPSVKAGDKYLIDLDNVDTYFTRGI